MNKQEYIDFFNNKCIKHNKFTVEYTGIFKKNAVKYLKDKQTANEVCKVLRLLFETGSLPKHYYPHKLKGNLKGYMEAHIKDDLLIIWKKNKKK